MEYVDYMKMGPRKLEFIERKTKLLNFFKNFHGNEFFFL